MSIVIRNNTLNTSVVNLSPITPQPPLAKSWKSVEQRLPVPMEKPGLPSLFPATLLDETQDDALVPGNQDDPSSIRNWWLAYTKSRHEKVVADRLFTRGVPFYLPIIEKRSRCRGRTQTSHVPLFSSYLFLYGNDQERVEALKTNSVCWTQLVPGGEQADQLRADLRRIAWLIATKAPVLPESRLQGGERVVVTGGDLKGLEGTVIRRQGKTRLLVAVDFLKQGASLAVDDFLLKPI